MKRYHRKRPDFFVFKYEETETLPREVREMFERFGVKYRVESTQLADNVVERVLVVGKWNDELRVSEGMLVLFDVENSRISCIRDSHLEFDYEEAPHPSHTD
jgi:hypothetical protein